MTDTEQAQTIATTIQTQTGDIETFTEFLSKYVKSNNVLSGRTKLYANYTPADMIEDNIKIILEDIFITHLQNKKEIEELFDYYKGIQDIYKKEKKVRPDVNNKICENNAFQIVEFKKGYVFGEPIQYVKRGESTSDEIKFLNNYMSCDDKSTIDKDIAEWLYICGLGYKLPLPNNKKNDDDEIVPFKTYILDPRTTFTVYSSDFKHEKLFSGTFIDYKDLTTKKKKRKFTIFTDKEMLTFESDIYDWLKQPKNITFESRESHTYGSIPIIEYELNPARLGLIELVKSILDALNKISSNDMDDIEQFVQALLVFINQEIDVDSFKEMLELGGIQISSTQPGIQADVKLLTAKLAHSETKIFYDRLYNNALTIVGIPRMNDKPSGGDTGQARLLGEGWTMADMRAKQDELSFIKSEKEYLKLIIRYCKGINGSNVKNIKLKDIDIKFTRNKSDNLLVKTQGLLTMMDAQVEPETAFALCGLFSDPNGAYSRAKQFYGDNFWKIKRSEKINNFNNLLVEEIARGNIKKQEDNKETSI